MLPLPTVAEALVYFSIAQAEKTLRTGGSGVVGGGSSSSSRLHHDGSFFGCVPRCLTPAQLFVCGGIVRALCNF